MFKIYTILKVLKVLKVSNLTGFPIDNYYASTLTKVLTLFINLSC